MVYYFTSNVVDPPATIYVGKDKFESLLLPSFLFTFHFFFFGLVLAHPHPIQSYSKVTGFDCYVWYWTGLD